MRVEPLVPDVPMPARARSQPEAFGRAVDELERVFLSASDAESAFAAGSGHLVEAVFERSQADVALAVATAGASRGVQTLQAIFNMQV